MYNARIEVGPAFDAGYKGDDVCARVATVTIQVSVMSAAPRLVYLFDPKQFTADSLDDLMLQIAHTLKDWGAT